MRSSHGLKVGLAAGIALMGASACATDSRQADIAYIEQPVETIYNNVNSALAELANQPADLATETAELAMKGKGA